MAYTVKCYLKTGFNSVNIPDKPSLLDDMESVDLPALDILQDWGLTSVRVRVSSDVDIQNVDYCKIGNEYYSVSAPSMVASDVAELPLVYDAITSAGGAGSLTYLDGITSRHTVSDDTMFKYTQPDELMGCNETLDMDVTDWSTSTDQQVKGQTVFMESTIDLVDLATTQDGITFTDPDDAENSVTVPYTKPAKATTYKLKSGDDERSVNNGTGLYIVADNYINVQNGAIVARNIGSESGIVAQYAVPADLIFVDEDTTSIGRVDSVAGVPSSNATGLKFKWSDSVKNNRVLYGDNCRYGILAVSGNKAEFKPEDIGAYNSDELVEGATYDEPYVHVEVDPRSDGKPYFRFLFYKGSSKNFWLNAVAGESWRQVPLIFQQKSGSVIDQYNFMTDRKLNDLSSEVGYDISTRKNVADAAFSLIDSAGQGYSTIKEGISTGNVGNAIKGLISTGVGVAQTAVNAGITQDTINFNRSQYLREREVEAGQYAISQLSMAPEISIAPSAGCLRDFVGNTYLVYRYHPTATDTARIDKLLTMYGYKDTVPLTADLFGNRTYFDYVRASGITIGGDIVMWKKALISAQLNTGVRVWHVKPDPAHYADNPIKGA